MTGGRKIIILAATLLTAGSALAQEGRRTDALTVALISDIRSSSPGVNRDANSDTVLHHVVEGLVAYREDLSVAPMLAESWQVEDGGRTYRFRLRDGVSFHNGAPLTSAEVVWSWRRYLDPKTLWACTRFFDGTQGPKVLDVEAPDPRTVVFRLQEASGLFLIAMANLQCNAAILHPDSIGPDGAWRAPIGTGPYAFRNWQRGRQIELARFEGYRPAEGARDGMAGAKIAYAERLRFLAITDASVMKTALLAGNVDVVPVMSPNDVDDAKARGIQVSVQSTFAWQVMLMQTRDPLLADVRVRRAIAHAVDLREVAQSLSFGLAGPNPAAVPLASPYYGSAFAAWPAHDPAAAKRLLKEAGYAGQPLRIQTSTRPGGYFDAAVMIQAMLAEAGINAQLETLEWATQLQNYNTGKFQLSSFVYSSRLDPALGYASLIGDKTRFPFAQWDDPQAKALLDAAKASSEPAERGRLFASLHQRMADAVPILGIYNPVEVSAAGPRVRGYKTWPAGNERFWGVWKE
ncbi:ABC transporter substrate-binding protein [Vineibacter terrae]|uniref:ABC transporter substrate-binding protein n=1 Tax=Vineibacter terrae TaxID=2586908 RepID=UPI002E2F22C2|nr:ABC transporter substrate-binding protein [Vineibacter terrae]HEX2889825.1 ABC transporter substrate-binding protein [Vineibacter terrae]